MNDIPDYDFSVLQKLLTGFERSEDLAYVNAASLTILLYDICTTIVDEVEFVWKDRWTSTKVLYLMTRYYPPIFTALTLHVVSTSGHSIQFCQNYFRFIMLGGYPTFPSVVNIVFIMRIHALYRRSQKVLIFFTILCLAEFGFHFYIAWVFSRETVHATFEPPIHGWRGCVTQPISGLVLPQAAWCLSAGVAFVFFAFTSFKFGDSLKDDHGRIRLDFLKEQKYLSPILTVIMRDGALFFLIILVTFIVNTALFNTAFIAFGLTWVSTIYSLVGSHMVLDLKRVGSQGYPTRITDTNLGLHDLMFARSY